MPAVPDRGKVDDFAKFQSEFPAAPVTQNAEEVKAAASPVISTEAKGEFDFGSEAAPAAATAPPAEEQPFAAQPAPAPAAEQHFEAPPAEQHFEAPPAEAKVPQAEENKYYAAAEAAEPVENPPAAGEKPPSEAPASVSPGESPTERHQAFDLGEDEEHPTETKRERLPSDYDVTEMELIQKQQQADMERRAMLEQKELEEKAKKRELQEKAEADLRAWADSRKAEIIARREKNKEEEVAFNEMRKAQSVAKNPWQKVVTNVDIKEGDYLGSKDVTRMRQSMNSRKNDVDRGIIQFPPPGE